MLVFFFRKRSPALAVRKLKDLRNPHFTWLWLASAREQVAMDTRDKAKEVLGMSHLDIRLKG